MEPNTRACPFCGGAGNFALTARDRNRETTEVGFAYERCTRCGTLYMREVPVDLAPFYAGEYHRFDADGAAEWEGNQTLRAVETGRVAMLAGQLASGASRSSTDRRLIDIGAGPGAFAAAAKHAGYEVTAIEMDERSCEYMRQRLDVQAICSDDPIAALGQVEPARVISLWHVLEHLRDPATMLATAVDRLQPGGVLAIGVPNPESVQFRLLGARWAHLDAPRHLRFVPAATLTERLRGLGLRPALVTSDDLFSRLCALHGWVYALRPRPADGDARRVTVRAAQAITKALAPLERRDLRGPALTLVFVKAMNL